MGYNYQTCLTTSHQIHYITVHVGTSEASCLLSLTGASVSQFALFHVLFFSQLLPLIHVSSLHTYSYILPLVCYSLKSCFPTILWKTYPCTCFLFPILCEFQDPWWGVEVGNCMLFYKWRKSSVRWRVKVNCDLGKPSLLWMSRPIFLTAWASV